MLSPARFLTPPVLIAVGALALSACSVLDGEDEVQSPDPSAISPDTVISCEDAGDCGEEGAVRWSMPMEGDYYVERFEGEPPLMRPVGTWMDYSHPSPGVVEADGVLYVHMGDVITALDTADGQPLWTESLDTDVVDLRVVGSTLLANGLELREEEVEQRLLHVDREGVRTAEPDQPDEVEQWAVVASDDTHLVFRETLDFHEEEDPRYYLVDAATGEVEWSTRVESARSHSLTEGTLYLQYSGEDEPGYVVAVSDGEDTAEFGVPEEAGDRSSVEAEADSPLLFDTHGCAPGGDSCGDPRITGVEPDEGEVLWTHSAPGAVIAQDAGSDGGGPRVHVHDEDGYRTLDARTGEVVAEDDEVDPAALLTEFGIDEWYLEDEFEEGELTEEEYDLLPVRPTGPGVDVEPLDGLAAGAAHLTTYEGPAGEFVGVYSGCAPDGLREPALDEPTGESPCAEPRLFAVDY
ncbi:outer membrane protein assembly factor BamB family protein [Nocardiopsis nanhaiensis]